jgi:uncharacterized membrane protein YgcG
MFKKVWAFAMFAVVAIFVTPSFADDCNTMVVDETGRLGSNIDKVERAGKELVNAGGDVRVRVIPDSREYGNLDRYMEAMQSRCASWQSGDGGRKNNLVVVVVSMDRQAGIFYGDQYKRALDPRFTSIRTDRMSPRFRDGDIAGGIASGIDAIRDYVVAAEAPPPVTGTQAPPIIIQQEPSKSMDLSGLWIVLKILLALVALGLLWYGISRFLNARAKRRAAQLKAQTARTACANRINELNEPISLVEARLNKLAQSVVEEDVAGLRSTLSGLKNEANRASALYTDYQQSASNPDRKGLSVLEYEGMAANFNGVLASLDKVRTLREGLDRDVQDALRRVASARSDIDALQQEIYAASVAKVIVQKAGYKTAGVEALLKEATDSKERAETLLSANRALAVESCCKEGTDKAKEAARQANGLPARRAAILEGITDLEDKAMATNALIASGRTAFDAMAATYAESCWTTVTGNGTEAENRVDVANEATTEASSAVAMSQQEWERAEAVLKEGNSALDEASSLMRSITELLANLEAAKRDAPEEIRAAAADLEKAEAYEHDHDDDINNAVKKEILAAQETLDVVKEEMSKDKPDYLVVLKNAKSVNVTADKILETCQSEHEAAERQRRRAVSSVRDAKASVSRAAEYIQDHSSDVESSAEADLRHARTMLADAEASSDLAYKIQRAEAADAKADSALKRAKSDVSDAEDARRRAAALRQSRASRSYSSGGGISIGGGMSRGGFGGGGSGGWGSSGRGGGGSGGW